MRTLLLLLVSGPPTLLAACDGDEPEAGDTAAAADGSLLEEHEFEDEDVTRLHRRMVREMAPDGGWGRARYIEFDWVVGTGEDASRRSHRYDRWEGRARVEMSSDDGELTAVFPVDAPAQGEARVDGEPLEGDEAEEALQRAHRTHVNDSYWLLMPYKWADPGVDAEYLGRQEEESREWEVVELTFDDVGLTPENAYRAFIDPDSGLMERWHHYRDADADPSPAEWTGWERFGPLLLATRRERDGELFIAFEDIRVEEDVPEGAFEP